VPGFSLAPLTWALTLAWAPPDPTPVSPDTSRDYAEVVEIVAPEREAEPPIEPTYVDDENRPGRLSADAPVVEYERVDDPPGEPPPKVKRWWRDRGHRFILFPSFRADSTIGAMPGIRFRYVYRKPGHTFNQVQVDLGARLSTRLVQQHDLRIRLRDLLGKNELFQFGAIFFNDPVFPYVGIDNHERLHNPDIDDVFYRADVLTTGAYFNYQQPIWTLHATGPRRAMGVLRWLAGVDVQADRIHPYEDSLLLQERPEDEGWTRRGTYMGGVTWDSRDNEWAPTKGGFHEATVAAAGPWAGASSYWGRLNVNFRWYRSLGTPKLVFAEQLMFDALVGPAPLYELGAFGGFQREEGLGGRRAGRGFYRRRYPGKVKGLAMTELRYQPFEWPILRRTLGLGFKAFADLGEVFQPDGILADGFHISGGGGIFVVWDRFFVFRVDVGASAEGLQWYLISGHTF
jgi:hypothetical protein